MTENPKISVITSFLNAERYIEETIKSVLAQTHRAWELLLVDDGSDDGSTGIARHYAALYPDKIRYFEHLNHVNLGASAARNVALAHAVGEYVAILDADDIWLPHALENRLKVIGRRPGIGMVYGPALLWYSWGGNPDRLQRDHMENLEFAVGKVFVPPAFCRYLLDYEAAIPSPCAILIRRDVLQSIDGFEDSFHTLFDDQVLYIKLSLKTSVFVSDICDSKYRQHAGSTCAVADREGRTDAARLIYLQWVRDYLQTQGVTDSAVWAALNATRDRFQRPWVYNLSQGTKRIMSRFANL